MQLIKEKNKIRSLEFLRENAKDIKSIAEYFNCAESEICVGDYLPEVNEVCPYAVILGNGKFENCTDASKLKAVLKDADFFSSQETDLSNLQIIEGNAIFDKNQVTGVYNLKKISYDAIFDHCKPIN